MALFGGLWWLERKERLECQKFLAQNLAVTSKAADALTSVAGEIRELRDDKKDSDARLVQLILALNKAA